MTRPSSSAIALCSAIAFGETAEAPEWVHLLPAGDVTTFDGRGPYRVPDGAKIASVSLQAGERLVLDECHSTDLAAPKGEPAPARGWIVELQARADGIWGKVEWTGVGRQLLEDRAYRGISPAIQHTKDKVVTRILRASLVNQPNLRGLQALHQEDGNMDFKNWLIETLGLDAGADDDAIMAALKAKLEAKTEDGAALQAALAPIAAALSLEDGADAAAVLAGVQKLSTSGDGDARVTALQSELAGVTTQLNDLREAGARKDAEAFVDGAIGEGRVGVKPMRDEYISMHMSDPEKVRKLIGAMPILKGTRIADPKPKDGETVLGEADQAVIALMGLDPDKYKATLAADAALKEERL